MTPKELKSLIKQLRSAGISHYKTPELELNLEPLQAKHKRIKPAQDEQEIKEIPHKVEELISIMKLGDNELVDLLFPLPTLDQDEAVQ